MARKRRRGTRTPSTPTYWQSTAYKQNLFYMFRDDLINLAMSRFKWVGLPDTCNARYLEWTLLMNGVATIAFPRSHRGEFRTLKAVMQGNPNCYGEPSKWQALGDTGKTRFSCDWSNGVFLYDNQTRYPLMSKLDIWARELSEIIITMDANRFQMRIPFIITGPQDRALDVQNVYNQMAQGQPVVLGYDSLADINMGVLMPERQKEFIGDKLYEQWQNIWQAAYQELGISSLPYKEERMIEDEVTSINEPSEFAGMGPLECRRVACRKLNDRFGQYLDGPIQCIWNRDNMSDNYNLMHRYDSLIGGGSDAARTV